MRDEFLVKFPNKICPDGWPVIWLVIVSKLLVLWVNDKNISEAVIILKYVFEPIGFLGANLKFTLLFVIDMLLSGRLKTTELNVLVIVGENVVFPVM